MAKLRDIGQSAQRILGQLLEKWISRKSERLSFSKIGNKGPRSSTVQGKTSAILRILLKSAIDDRFIKAQATITTFLLRLLNISDSRYSIWQRSNKDTWHLPSIQMSIDPELHEVPSMTLEASLAEKRYCGSFGLQNNEHG